MSVYLGMCHGCGSEDLSIVLVKDKPEPVEKWIDHMKVLYEQSIHEFPPFKLAVADVESYVCCSECGNVSDIIEYYKEEYRPNNQVRMDDVIVDPKQRHMFDNLNNALRPGDEHDDWYGLPYIDSRGEDRYDVRCYDGGAWDRSTTKGFNLSLYDAIAFVKDNYSEY